MEGATEAPRVFVSHDRDGAEFVRALADWLAGEGIETWSPIRDLRFGEPFAERISAAVRSATAAVIVLTPHAPTPSQRDEWSDLLDRDAVERLTLVPVLLGTEQMPPFLRGRQMVSASPDSASWQKAFTQIQALLDADEHPEPSTAHLRDRLARDAELLDSDNHDGDVELELAAAERELHESIDTGDSRLLAELLRRVGVLQVRLGLLDEGSRTLRRALETAAGNPDVPARQQAIAAHNLAGALFALGRHDEALEAVANAMSLIDEPGVDQAMTAAIAFNAGRIVGESGNPASARQLLEGALRLSEPVLGSDHATVREYRRTWDELS